MIELINIQKHYSIGKKIIPILVNINLQVVCGEFVAIMGPSGSGKSTLMNMIGLLDKPSSGKYLLGGEDLAEYNSEKLAALRNLTVGFVFQSFMLMPRMNVIENVSLPLFYRGTKPNIMLEKSKAILSRVGLLDYAFRKP